MVQYIYIYTYITPRTKSWTIYIYTYVPPRTKSWCIYIYIYNSKDKVLDYTCFLFKKKKTSLFRTLPVRQTSYCFVMVLAIVFIFKDHILVYICSNLHIYIYMFFNTYIYLYISVVLINYIYLGFISCRAPKVPKSAHPITARYKMMRPAASLHYKMHAVINYCMKFQRPSRKHGPVYIYIYIHNSKDKVLDYIYIYTYVPPRTKSWYIYIYNSKDKVLDYICFLFKKKKTSLFRTLPVRQTSYCFVMVLAIVFIFKDHILVYICSNLHIYIYMCFNTYIYLYISVVLINYIYLGFISCRAPKVPKSAHPITARYKMMRPPHFTTKCML